MVGAKSIACVTSPLQLINVYAAMKRYNALDCDIYIVDDRKSNRHLQIQKCADFFGLKYVLIDDEQLRITSVKLILSLLLMPLKKRKYDYLFFGDYRNGCTALFFARRLKRGGKVVFVDDGNASIGVLQGLDIDRKTKVFYAFFRIWGKVLNISSRDFFTVYKCKPKIDVRVVQNDFLKVVVNAKMTSEIYFVGTVVNVFADALGLNGDELQMKIELALKRIVKKYSQDHIVFIPHGRDDGKRMKDFCEANSIEYRRLDQCIELHCITKGCFPKAVYGLTSTALMNIKLMSPQTSVFDYNLSGPNVSFMKILDEIRAHYKANGVEYIAL